MAWDDLRFLLAVQRHGSLAAASRALKVDQTTVGRRLNALQTQLGTRLFSRNASGYQLTAAGLHACSIGQEMEAAAINLDRVVAGRDAAIEGTVRITAPAGSIPVIAGALAELQLEHPGLRFHVLSDVATLNLVKGEADIALRAVDPGQPSLIARRLYSSPWALYAAAPYLRRCGVPPPDLAGHEVVGYDETLARTPGAVWLREHAPEASVVLRTNNVIAALDFAATGIGIVTGPCFLATRESKLQRVLSPLVTGSSDMFLVTHSDLVDVPRVRATIDRLTVHMRAQVEWLAGEH